VQGHSFYSKNGREEYLAKAKGEGC